MCGLSLGRYLVTHHLHLTPFSTTDGTIAVAAARYTPDALHRALTTLQLIGLGGLGAGGPGEWKEMLCRVAS